MHSFARAGVGESQSLGMQDLSWAQVEAVVNILLVLLRG